MSIRSKILTFLLNPMLRGACRIRVVQTLEMLEHTGPFTVPKYQGDVVNECSALRRWVNSGLDGPYMDLSQLGTGVSDAYGDPVYQEWARACPFKREIDSDEWAQRSWLWG